MHYKKSLAINENSNCNKNKSNRIIKKNKLKRNIFLRQIGIDNCCGSRICIQFQINANTLYIRMQLKGIQRWLVVCSLARNTSIDYRIIFVLNVCADAHITKQTITNEHNLYIIAVPNRLCMVKLWCRNDTRSETLKNRTLDRQRSMDPCTKLLICR